MSTLKQHIDIKKYLKAVKVGKKHYAIEHAPSGDQVISGIKLLRNANEAILALSSLPIDWADSNIRVNLSGVADNVRQALLTIRREARA